MSRCCLWWSDRQSGCQSRNLHYRGYLGNQSRGSSGSHSHGNSWSRCSIRLEMRVNDISQNFLHTFVAGLKLFDGLLNGRNEVLLAISGHFGVHSIAFATVVIMERGEVRVNAKTNQCAANLSSFHSQRTEEIPAVHESIGVPSRFHPCTRRSSS